MSLLFNMLSRFVIPFLPRNKHHLTSPFALLLETTKIKVCHCFHCFPSICHEVMGPDAMILVFWMLSFKPAFSLCCLTFIKRLFSFSSLSVIRVVSSAYLRLYFSWQSWLQLVIQLVLLTAYRLYLIFQRASFLFCCFFPIDFQFSFSLIYTLIFTIFFPSDFRFKLFFFFCFPKVET